ncbi:MAG: RNA-protein complex protein Nop10 [Candidatus Micrarchaeota archaeon]|nr:RNA-protein complex protein Nop10 [Candidatus Micrarchaeota archaeon]
MKRMRRCVCCRAYTLEKEHCGRETASPHPPKFTAEDPYAQYRRKGRWSGL